MTGLTATIVLLLVTGPDPESEPREPSQRLGSVVVTIGSPAEPAIAELSRHFQTRAIGGGWEVRPRVEDSAAPIAAVRVGGTRVLGVSLRGCQNITD
jgi:hypothetical protein